MQRLVQFLLLFTLLGLTACQSSKSEPELLPVGIQLGDKYYTQVTMQYEKGKYRTTNYRRGILLAVNTEVELLDITSKSIKLRLIKDNLELLVVNVPKHTGDDIYQAFDKLFAKKPLDLNKFNALERKNIGLAQAVEGMSKAAVLVAIGYPPANKTPSLDSDEWRYWSNRFNTFVVHFSDGKVSRIQN